MASDNFRGGYLAGERLIALGCRNPLFFRVYTNLRSETNKRGEGFAAACEALGVRPTFAIFEDVYGTEAALRYLDGHIHNGALEYDGIFCDNDLLAYQVIERLAAHGVRVPEDVQIIGFDGTRRFFTGTFACSTIVQPVRQMAEAAVDLLFSPDPPPELVCLPVRYAAGGTTREPVEGDVRTRTPSFW